MLEGGKEWLQTSLDGYYRNLALMEEKEINLLSEEAIYNGMLGALTAGLFETPGMMNRIVSGGSNQNAAAMAKGFGSKNESGKTFYENFFGELKGISERDYNGVLQIGNFKDKIDIQNGVSYFPKSDEISENVKKVKPEICEGTNKYYFDIGIHGNRSEVALSREVTTPKFTPMSLAIVISQNKNYVKDTPIRLLSCNTGALLEYKNCFAQELANILNVKVSAPTDILYIKKDVSFKIGKENQGKWELFEPHYKITNEFDSDWRIMAGRRSRR